MPTARPRSSHPTGPARELLRMRRNWNCWRIWRGWSSNTAGAALHGPALRTWGRTRSLRSYLRWNHPETGEGNQSRRGRSGDKMMKRDIPMSVHRNSQQAPPRRPPSMTDRKSHGIRVRHLTVLMLSTRRALGVGTAGAAGSGRPSTRWPPRPCPHGHRQHCDGREREGSGRRSMKAMQRHYPLPGPRMAGEKETKEEAGLAGDGQARASLASRLPPERKQRS